jgi:DNA-binding response OmpR family regulator
MTCPTILTIEDDSAIRKGIVDALQFAGYDVLQAADGQRGLEMALRCEFDLLLLDLVLPGPDGFEILSRLREDRPTLPIILLTARGEESDRVRGLRDGADDYVVKPFSVKELLARVEAVLRRSPARPEPVATVDIPGGRIDLARREVTFDDGRQAELSERETDLLRYLATHRGRAVTRDELLSNVWRIPPRGVSTRTIDMQVARLREKIEIDPANPAVIFTVRGKGYRFARNQGPEDANES